MLEESIKTLDGTVAELCAQIKALSGVMQTVSAHQRSLLDRMEAVQGGSTTATKKTEPAKPAAEPKAASEAKPAGRRKKAAEPVEEKEVGSAKDLPLEKGASDEIISESALVDLGRKWVLSLSKEKRGEAATFISQMGYATGAYEEGEKVKLGGEGCKLTPEQRDKCRFFIKRAAELGIPAVNFDAEYDFKGAVNQPEPKASSDDYDDVTTEDDLDF